MAFLELKNISVGFGPQGSRTEVLKDVNLSVEENEFVAIIGFSGSGKSTLINLLSALVTADKGEILLRGESIKEPGPHLGIMFQNYSLLPWLSVYGNIELAVRQVNPSLKGDALNTYIEHYISMVNLLPARDKKPAELSGGMRQRASLARTLSMKPEILLLDEPLSALDALTRANIQDEIIRVWEQDKRTIVMITNDVDEAVLMADRIVPLTKGPEASLADSFLVPFARPRNRTELNLNPDFRTLRNTITRFMVDMNESFKASSTQVEVALPDVMPIDFNVMPYQPLKQTKRRISEALNPTITFSKS